MSEPNVRCELLDRMDPALDKFLVEKYHSAYCNLSFFRHFYDCTNPPAIAVYEDGALVHLFPYRINGRTGVLLNHFAHVPPKYIKLFVETFFEQNPGIRRIDIGGQYERPTALGYPFVRKFIRSDVLLPLPDSLEQYTSQLGKQTRKHIKYYQGRLRKEFPSIEFQAFEREACSPEIVHAIIELNRQRILAKRMTPGIDAPYEQRIVNVVRDYGSVGAISIDGRIAAGSICYKMSNDYFLHVIAHSNDYSKYNLGQVCLYWTIGHCIHQGGKTFHFMWEQCDYKERFLGVRTELYFYDVHRRLSLAYCTQKISCAVPCLLMSYKRHKWLRQFKSKYYDRCRKWYKNVRSRKNETSSD